MSDDVWKGGETLNGQTIAWLKRSAAELGVHLGIGFLEVDGEEFYNSYAIATSEGRIAGVVRKTMAETACFRCWEDGPKVIETALGRIGVGICADNLFARNLRIMQHEAADILLMPHAAPRPMEPGKLASQKDVADAYETMAGMAGRYAKLIGIPVLFTNMVGERAPGEWFGMLGKAFAAPNFRLGGLATIVDARGEVLARIEEQMEGVIVADVLLDPACKISEPVKGHGSYGGGFVTPHPFLFEMICYIDAFNGKLHYRWSKVRKEKARDIQRA
jgi:N-carbamoylputrescine amidase